MGPSRMPPSAISSGLAWLSWDAASFSLKALRAEEGPFTSGKAAVASFVRP